MTEGIVIALIGAIGAVLAAVIAGVFSLLKKGKLPNSTKIKQKQNGKSNMQIGIQNNYEGGKVDE